ncbi:MAG: hypothetical protein HQL21_09860, partial [Candidatus Omnitrophica bacterium]|nr:hypothetical protein [Candidatus Omnitrophota bacterium]
MVSTKTTSLKTRLVLHFLCIALVPLVITSVMVNKVGEGFLKKQILNAFNAINQIKEMSLASYLKEKMNRVGACSRDEHIVESVIKHA